MESKYTTDYYSEKQDTVLDEKTGLYTRTSSLALLDKMIAEHEKVYVVVLDIDNFKSMNDRFGYEFGDEVIQKLSAILKEASGSRGFAGRFGDDDFFLCLCDIESELDLKSILQSIYFHFKRAFMEKDHKFSLTMGISEYPQNSGLSNILIKKAEKALELGKEKGKNRYIIYKEFVHGEIE